MTETNAPAPASAQPSLIDRLTPRASVRVQLVSAAVLWLVGLGFLLVRGVIFMRTLMVTYHAGFWLVPILALAVVIGVVKAQFILIKYARKSVARIYRRGRACYFGFFSWASWGFILVMMGGGIALREFTPLPHSAWGLTFLSLLYIAVGTGLAIADRVFWIAALSPIPATEPTLAAE